MLKRLVETIRGTGYKTGGFVPGAIEPIRTDALLPGERWLGAGIIEVRDRKTGAVIAKGSVDSFEVTIDDKSL